MDFKHRAVTHESRFSRPQGRSRKLRRKNSLKSVHILRGLKQARTPLRKNGRDLVMVFFDDEIVQARLRLEEQGVERPLRSIVRTQLEVAVRWNGWGEIERINGRESETAKIRRNHRGRGALAAAEEKVTAAWVYWMEIGRMTRLPCPTQSDAPGDSGVGPKSNSLTEGRQGWMELPEALSPADPRPPSRLACADIMIRFLMFKLVGIE